MMQRGTVDIVNHLSSEALSAIVKLAGEEAIKLLSKSWEELPKELAMAKKDLIIKFAPKDDPKEPTVNKRPSMSDLAGVKDV